ncbi:Hypothetical predicted protein [Mytilus galloprovincialis]|nr:Hypothetical predicted protein [Mytilus galloprovincialis]
MPLLSNNLKAPLFADFDVSALNEQLKDYIDQNIISTFTKQVEDIVSKKQSDIGTHMLKEYMSKLEQSDVLHGETFSRMFNEFEQRFFNLSEKQSENATKLMTDVKEWKTTLMETMKEHSGKLQKSETAYEKKLLEILRNYSYQSVKISGEVAKNITDLKTNIEEWKNNLGNDLVKSITNNLTQTAKDVKEWKTQFTDSLQEHIRKLQKSEIAHEKKMLEIQRNYSDQSVNISGEATQNITDLKTNIEEWKNNLGTDLVKSITNNLTQTAKDVEEWKNMFSRTVARK